MTDTALKIGEYHPCADSAMAYVKSLMSDLTRWCAYKEALASAALSGNRLSEICLATAERIERNDPVSDRYLLGLAWLLKDFDEEKL